VYVVAVTLPSALLGVAMPYDFDILDAVRECFRRVMSLDEAAVAAIDEHTQVSDVGAWDSVAHVQLVLALEERFGVRFEDERVVELVSVNAIMRTLTGDE